MLLVEHSASNSNVFLIFCQHIKTHALAGIPNKVVCECVRIVTHE